MLSKILDRFTYVKDLKVRIRQLEATSHTLMTQKGEAVRNEKECKEKYTALKNEFEEIEAGFISILEEPHMIYNNLQSNGKKVCIAGDKLEELKRTKSIRFNKMAGQNVFEFKTVLRGKGDKGEKRGGERDY